MLSASWDPFRPSATACSTPGDPEYLQQLAALRVFPRSSATALRCKLLLSSLRHRQQGSYRVGLNIVAKHRRCNGRFSQDRRCSGQSRCRSMTKVRWSQYPLVDRVEGPLCGGSEDARRTSAAHVPLGGAHRDDRGHDSPVKYCADTKPTQDDRQEKGRDCLETGRMTAVDLILLPELNVMGMVVVVMCPVLL